MIKNYLKTTFRNVRKQGVYSLINLLGLTVSIACALLIIIYIHFELTFDGYHENFDRIYRINTEFSFGDITMTTNLTPAPVLEASLNEFPEVKNGTRVYKTFNPMIVGIGVDKFEENQFYYADSTFFSVFDFPLLHGNSNDALVNPKTVVITEDMARKYFDRIDVVGESLDISGQPFLITGIAQNPPPNTHLKFDFLASFVTLARVVENKTWDSANYFTFLLLNNGAEEQRTQEMLQAKVNEEMVSHYQGTEINMTLVPLGDIHLKSDVADELYKGDITYVYVFILITILIVIMACVNYMNLASARSVHRAKEVGMRKVMGAKKPQLFFQFMGESGLLTAIGILVGMVFTSALLPYFSDIAGRPLDLSLFQNPLFYLILLLFWVMISLLAGTYPAFVLSSFSAGIALKPGLLKMGSGSTMRKFLVIFQFAVAVFLFIGSAVIIGQLDYIQTKKLGYDLDQLVVLPADQTVLKTFDSFKSELNQYTDVEDAALTNESLVQVRGGYDIKVEGVNQDNSMLTSAIIVSPEFVETTGLSLIAGEGFTATDLKLSSLEIDRVQNVLINEEAARHLYLSPEEAVGRKSDLNGRKGVIKGVLKNFHFRSLREKVQPIVLFIEPYYFTKMVVRIKGSTPLETIQNLQTAWESRYDHRPFEFQFLNEEYNALYQSEQQLKQVYSVFTILALFIGCLGLFGLVSFSTVQRTKEIGIRKILGASIGSIVALISADFLKLVLIGFILAVPFSYWFMTNWLNGFEYRIGFSWQAVAITLFAQVLLTMLVISWQSIKAALKNPVNAIRNDL